MPRTALSTVLLIALALTASACSREAAEEKGKRLATEKIDVAKGIGNALEEKGSAAAESVAGGVGKVVQGLGKGLEKSGRNVKSAPSVEQAGLQITKVQDATPGGETPVHGIEAYVLAKQDVRGELRVVLFDLLDREIGRTKVAVARTADEGKYLAIPLDAQINLHDIARVNFDFQPGAATAQK